MELKKLFLNEQYMFDFDGNCNINNQTNCYGDPNLISIVIDSVNQILNKRWLGLIAHYEVDLSYSEVSKISFIECRSKVIGLKCGYLMVIKTPIEYPDDFRLIPGFPGFIINKDGLVMSRKTGRTLKEAIGPYGYPYVNIYDPDKSKWRSVSTHILLARAFVRNDNPGYCCFINHRDGNKLNYALRNLQWTSSRGNNLHAVRSGLRNDNFPCRVRDIDTGQETSFPSIGLALSKIGLTSKSKKISRSIGSSNIPILFLNRYEIKLADDSGEWYYSKLNRDEVLRLKGPYQAYNIKTGSIIEGNTIKILTKETKISEERILNALRSTKPKCCQNYIFRIKCEDKWPAEYESTVYTAPRKIIATNLNTAEVLKFNSIRKLVGYLSIDKRTLKEKLHSGKSHHGWLFKEEIPHNSPID